MKHTCWTQNSAFKLVKNLEAAGDYLGAIEAYERVMGHYPNHELAEPARKRAEALQNFGP
jgi:hypothetical protein